MTKSEDRMTNSGSDFVRPLRHSDFVIRHFFQMSAPALSSAPAAGFTSERFAAHLAASGHLPAWWLEARKAAWNQFLALPLPASTDERWRFSNLKGISFDGFDLAGAPGGAAPAAP